MVTGVKLSQIASGGAFVPLTDEIVTVRNGNTDVITTLSGGVAISVPITSSGTTIAATSGWTFIPIENNTGSAFTIYLPASPATNQLVSMVDVLGTAGAHNITINGNGNNIVAYGNVGASTFVLNAPGSGVNPLAWDATDGEWILFGSS